MNTFQHVYDHDTQRLQGYVADSVADASQKPAVLVVHDWSGQNAFARERAEYLAKQGYLGFAVDMFGDGRIGETVAEKQALIQPFLLDRALLRARMQAALDAVKSLPQVDPSRIAVIGFCFGGLCALDLARDGAEVRAVVSFHGLLDADPMPALQPFKAKVLALHGHDDPMVSQSQLDAFCEEMTHLGVDWQLHVYGQTQHAFTNPLAHDAKMGTVYNAQTAQRAFEAMTLFLREVL